MRRGLLHVAAAWHLLCAPGAPAATFADDLGDTLRWEIPPRRLVSLSPSITETLFALGVRAQAPPGDQAIVGVTRFCDHPPDARRIHRVGGIVDPSLEEIRAVNPDLVILTRGNPRSLVESLRDLNIPSYAMETNGTLRQLVAAMARLGAVIGRPAAADSLAAALEERIERLEDLTGSRAPDARPRVFYGTVDPPYWTAGPGSTVDDLIRLSGGTNIAADAPSPWCIYSLESIVAADPQVLLAVHPPGREEETRRRLERELAQRPAWRDTEAGRTRRICLVEEDLLLRPGPRLIMAAEQLASCLHPGLFPGDRGHDGGR